MSHDASRTGAPVLLGAMLRWLVRGGRCDVRVVVQSPGPLVAEYRRFAPVKVVDSAAVRAADRVLAGLGSVAGISLGRNRLWSMALRSQPPSDVVVANTIAALEPAVALARTGCRLVCHVHELDHVAERIFERVDRRAMLLDSVDRFIATGPAVEQMLVERWGVDAARVSTVDAFIELSEPSELTVESARYELTGDSDAPLVVSVGAMRRRKGPERFVELMGLLADHPTMPRGVWIGGDARSVEWHETEKDIREAGLDGVVRLVQSVDDALPYIAAADVVVSVAREDPFPLVALEAGSMGVPVVGGDAGGLGHMLRRAGLEDSVVPLGDLFLLASRVGRLLGDRRARHGEGLEWQRWVRETHTVDQIAPVLWDAIAG